MHYTPENRRLEPENHPFEKENHLPNPTFFWFHVNFPGCIFTHIWLVMVDVWLIFRFHVSFGECRSSSSLSGFSRSNSTHVAIISRICIKEQI